MPWCLVNNEWVECDTLPSDSGPTEEQIQHDWEAGTDIVAVGKKVLLISALVAGLIYLNRK